MNNIHLIPAYNNCFTCKGYQPINLENAKGHYLKLEFKYNKFGITYKTMWGGMCGDGLLNYNDETIKEVINHSKGQITLYSFEEHKNLEDYGFKLVDDTTMIINISDKDLWNKIDKNNRTAIRYAEKNDVIFGEVKSLEELKELLNLFSEQAKRWNFRIPSKDYFSNIWNEMVSTNQAKFFYAKKDNEVITIAQIFMCEDVISMPIWGNNDKSKELKANNFLIWKIIEWGNQNNYKSFNLWGANKSLEGIWNFKLSFNAEIVKVYRYEKYWLPYKILDKLRRLKWK